MKILHIFPVSLYSNVYLEFISKHYDSDEHEFIMIDIGGKIKTEEKYYEIFKLQDISTFVFSDVFVLNKRLKVNDYKKLVVHSLYLNYLVVSLALNSKVLKKSIITLWGGADCGKFIVPNGNKKYFIQAIAYNFIRKKVFRNVAEIGATLKSDYDLVVKDYQTKSKMVECKYLIPTKSEYLETTTVKKDNIIRVQVGHSGSHSGNQLEILEKLLAYKELPIEIYCPLSYGDEDNIKQIIEFGESNFKDKFHAMTKLMPSDEFSKFINRMDILIINTEIQQALGNIYSYLYARKKVYLRNGSSLWNYFNELKFTVFNASELSEVDFDQFKQIDVDVKEDNHEKSEIQFDGSKIKKYWDNIFGTKED